ncbi:hypothetical protein ACETIH_27815 [Microvirga arabica]|uniref:Uncharacterized protein n=1 Tax=Microvirga arabica TaxID=1128671 RepID=A0ABV6YGR6_9HYPH
MEHGISETVSQLTAAGKRQIVSFNISGDIPDLQSLHLKTLDNSVSTISTAPPVALRQINAIFLPVSTIPPKDPIRAAVERD